MIRSIYSLFHSIEAFEQRSLLPTGMWRHLFPRVLQNITQSSPWISDSIKVAWHSLSGHKSSGHLIYNCSFSSGLPSHVKSFLSIICQRWFLINSFDECTNCVYFNVITKIKGFPLWGKKNLKAQNPPCLDILVYFSCSNCKKWGLNSISVRVLLQNQQCMENAILILQQIH